MRLSERLLEFQSGGEGVTTVVSLPSTDIFAKDIKDRDVSPPRNTCLYKRPVEWPKPSCVAFSGSETCDEALCRDIMAQKQIISGHDPQASDTDETLRIFNLLKTRSGDHRWTKASSNKRGRKPLSHCPLNSLSEGGASPLLHSRSVTGTNLGRWTASSSRQAVVLRL